MGILWEAYHKGGVPLLGVPENPTDKMCNSKPGGSSKSYRSLS